MDAKQRRALPLGAGGWLIRLCEPDVGGQRVERNGRVDPPAGVERGRAKPVVAVTAAALPRDCFADAALLAIDDLVEAWLAMRLGVVAHLNADPAASHLVGHSGSRAGTEEAV